MGTINQKNNNTSNKKTGIGGIILIIIGFVLVILGLILTLFSDLTQIENLEQSIDMRWGMLSVVTGIIILIIGLKNYSTLNKIAKHVTTIQLNTAQLAKNQLKYGVGRIEDSKIYSQEDVFHDFHYSQSSNIAVLYETLEKINAIRQNTPPSASQVYNQAITSILHCIGNAQKSMGRTDEALLFYEEVLSIQTEIAENQPSSYQQYIANMLNNMGNAQRDLKRYEDALHSYHKAHDIYSRLARKEPHLYNQDVAMTLINIGTLQLKEIQNKRKSIKAAKMAIKLIWDQRFVSPCKQYIETAYSILNQCGIDTTEYYPT